MDQNPQRLRKTNFVEAEVGRLLELMLLHKEALFCKLGGALTAASKRRAWQSIADAVTAIGHNLRTVKECRKKWQDLKSAAMAYSRDAKKTGGGPPMRSPPYLEMILQIIGDDSATLNGFAETGADSYSFGNCVQEPPSENFQSVAKTGADSYSFGNCVQEPPSENFQSVAKTGAYAFGNWPTTSSPIQTTVSPPTEQIKDDEPLPQQFVINIDDMSTFVLQEKPPSSKKKSQELYNDWLVSQIAVNESQSRLNESQLRLNESQLRLNNLKAQLIQVSIEKNLK